MTLIMSDRAVVSETPNPRTEPSWAPERARLVDADTPSEDPVSSDCGTYKTIKARS